MKRLGRGSLEGDATSLLPYLSMGRVGNAIGTHLALPQLRGFWPMSSIDDSFNAYDLSGQNRTLTANSLTSASFGTSSLTPYVDFDGTADYYSRADEAGLDLGNDLTSGGWFYFDGTSTTSQIIGKGVSGTNISFKMTQTNADLASVVHDGTSADTKTYTSQIVAGWHHLVQVAYLDTNIKHLIYFDGEALAEQTSSLTTINNSTAAFTIGSISGGGNYFDGRASMCFICNTILTAAHVAALFSVSRGLYSV